MDDFIVVILDLIFWLCIIDFTKKGQATAKIVIWIAMIACFAGVAAYVLAV